MNRLYHSSIQLTFDKSFSFIYSARPGTPAAELVDHLPLQEKKQRLYELQKKLSEHMAESMQAKVGTVQAVLVEGLSKHDVNEMTGRASNNTAVVFKASVEQIGQFVQVYIEQAFTNSLKGRLVC